ncbi:hypothetical protein CIT25_21845 [Mesorhizobium mediterraneum]|uniref:Uncharacterized protein n=1 Tax=Mesorhizobium mediterraneum TaxID=43617 RepID=A0AB36R7G0_9HYPH|nr:hypothetical protein CIT25_21845 [Mesorhizobium mediterraneum]
MQSQQFRRFGLNLTKICEAQIKTPLTTGDKASIPVVSFFADETVSGGQKILKSSPAAPLLFCREVD